jgi:phage shock protein A
MSDVIKANINDLLDKAEDPEKMSKQMVLEMEESVNKATVSVAQSIANQKQIQRRLDKEQDQDKTL